MGSTGWWVGPSSPRATESWVMTKMVPACGRGGDGRHQCIALMRVLFAMCDCPEPHRAFHKNVLGMRNSMWDYSRDFRRATFDFARFYVGFFQGQNSFSKFCRLQMRSQNFYSRSVLHLPWLARRKSFAIEAVSGYQSSSLPALCLPHRDPTQKSS